MTFFKPATKKNQGYFLAFILALLSLSFLSSCNKNDDEQFPELSLANLKIVHSLPGLSSLDFYLNGRIITAEALLYGDNIGYGSVYSGANQVDVVPGGTFQSVARSIYNFAEDKSYSLFVTRKSAVNDTITTLLTEDNLEAPPAGKAKLRFIHLSQNAPALDLAIQGGTTLFTNQAFNQYTEFIAVDPGTLTFQIKDTGTSTVRASSAEAVNITAGKIYTIWAEGLVNGSGDANLGVQVIQN